MGIFLPGSEFHVKRTVPPVEDAVDECLTVSIAVDRKSTDPGASELTVRLIDRSPDEPIPTPLRGLVLRVSELRGIIMFALDTYERATRRKLFYEGWDTISQTKGGE